MGEWISSMLLQDLQINAATSCVIRVPPGIEASTGDIEEGLYLGSQYPGDSEQLAVYDFLPDALLHRCLNLIDFTAILVFDTWTCKVQPRKAVFFRVCSGFVVQMINNAYAFGGSAWRFTDAPRFGSYHSRLVYENVRSWNDLQPWLDKIMHYPEHRVSEVYRRIPTEWLEADDKNAVESVMCELLNRRKHVPDLMTAYCDSPYRLFNNWRLGA
jgi:hypothetical protein